MHHVGLHSDFTSSEAVPYSMVQADRLDEEQRMIAEEIALGANSNGRRC